MAGALKAPLGSSSADLGYAGALGNCKKAKITRIRSTAEFRKKVVPGKSGAHTP